ncbi:hypothetical protein BCR36DRAFT_417283 [Piromyces finnis]|uniref:Uncharacterized protein n=1 Tax=Piromyces finnis TaxID=1754191 RepID=A0A1Y1U883_9FUNG|nr:hypothetical protein BCR36DRAFT_417283 [Piromyces finnis]|eukprot:ORX33325.1 hypothetical protein BCR36DRAFT_417283 [Piromyces finnis]
MIKTENINKKNYLLSYGYWHNNNNIYILFGISSSHAKIDFKGFSYISTIFLNSFDQTITIYSMEISFLKASLELFQTNLKEDIDIVTFQIIFDERIVLAKNKKCVGIFPEAVIPYISFDLIKELDETNKEKIFILTTINIFRVIMELLFFTFYII